jgi:hypothetical protein
MSEGDIKADIRLSLGRLPDVRLFNNPVGEAWTGKIVDRSQGFITLMAPRCVTYGLAPGSSDLIGLRRVVVTPEMVGRTLALFAAIEVKPAKGGHYQPGQKPFIEFVRDFGGVAGVARSAAGALQVLGYPT